MTSVEALKMCVWVKCRNMICDDFDLTLGLKEGSVESLKQLFSVNVNSDDVGSVNARYSPAEVPVNVRRFFTTNALSLEDFLKIYIPPEHWHAIDSRAVFMNLSDVRGVPGIPDRTNLVPQMELDALAAYIESYPSVRTAGSPRAAAIRVSMSLQSSGPF